MIDFIGHGQSQGERGYIETFQQYTDDFVQFIKLVWTERGETKKPVVPSFILGHSMGATVSIQTMRHFQQESESDEQLYQMMLNENERKQIKIDENYTEHTAPKKHQGKLSKKARKKQAHRERLFGTSNNNSTTNSTANSTANSTSNSPTLNPISPSPQNYIAGVIMSSPALIPDPVAVNPLLQVLATILGDVLPKFGFTSVLPLDSLSRVQTVVQRFICDPLTYSGNMTAR